MYILTAVLHSGRSKLRAGAPDRSGMHENRPHYVEVSFRGDKRGHCEDERRLFRSVYESAVQRAGFRPPRKWLILLMVCLVGSLLVINTYTTGQFRIVRLGGYANLTGGQEPDPRPNTFYQPIITPGYLVYNRGCRIPEMDPLDPAIRRYIQHEDEIICEAGTQPPLIESNETSLFVVPEARDFYYNRSEPVYCCWREFWRTENEDNEVTFSKDCRRFRDSAFVDVEFAKVECWRGSERIYRDYYAFVPRKDYVENRCRSNPPGERTLSVLIIGIDSVSRLNFHRMMPKTAKALTSAGAVEMLGYNKVGDNTYPNLVPVLSGWSQEELKANCWQEKKKPFDECPFLWKNFSSSGYRTAFAEDACSMTTFNYLKPGFRSPPTDYYLRPYCIAAENDIGNTHKLNANLCLGTRKNHDSLISYALKIARTYPEDRYFAFVWQSSLTHDFFNYPQLGDTSYHDLLQHLLQENLLKDTALIFMSDHGIRWGEFRQTYQGRTEESLPFVFLLLPDWFKSRYPSAWANLRRNSRSLTTAYDLHETLLDLVDPARTLHEDAARQRTDSLSHDKLPRGISWFLPIPDHRTCSLADIPGHWCMCHGSNPVNFNDTTLQHSVDYLVNELNSMLKRFPQCAQLQLDELIDAKMWSGFVDEEKEEKDKAAPWIDYTLTLRTLPGNAIFEGSVRYRSDDGSRKMIGTVSRLNAYGKQSACVDEFNMRLYCYCT